jgi:hypothetical protein
MKKTVKTDINVIAENCQNERDQQCIDVVIIDVLTVREDE